MTLVRWDPLRELASLQQRLSRPSFAADDSYGSWVPPVDIVERGDDLVIRAELPGVKIEDIDVRVENNTLVLQGERKQEERGDEDQAFRLERVHGTFVRSFRLPKTVDANSIQADYRNGVLQLVLPKAEEAKPRKIEITAA